MGILSNCYHNRVEIFFNDLSLGSHITVNINILAKLSPSVNGLEML